MPKILIVDDEKAIRRTLKEILEYEKYDIDEAEDGEIGLEKIEKNNYDVVILDIKMPKKDGLEVLTEMQQKGIETPVIVLSGHGNLETAVEAVKKGAFDYIPKPPDLNRLLITVRNAMDKVSLVTETKILKKKIAKSKDIVGDSNPILKIKETIAKVAPTEARVLITGDNGSGKELVARWLHEQSNRANGPLIEVNCAAIPSELIESELFGHEKGAFTSAIKQRIGKFEQANGGTLFLDEIGDMSLSAQAKVLRALQENKITKVGGDKEEKVDVRVVAATNKDLLKERKDDIPVLTEHFLNEICGDYGIPVKKIENDAIETMQARNWTGNIRELRNVVERLVIMSEKTITKQDVIDYSGPSTKAENKGIDFDKFANLQQLNDYVERSFIENKLDKNSWNTSKTAEDIGLSKKQLEDKLESLGLKKR